jgi:hypothetical protein
MESRSSDGIYVVACQGNGLVPNVADDGKSASAARAFTCTGNTTAIFEIDLDLWYTNPSGQRSLLASDSSWSPNRRCDYVLACTVSIPTTNTGAGGTYSFQSFNGRFKCAPCVLWVNLPQRAVTWQVSGPFSPAP